MGDTNGSGVSDGGRPWHVTVLRRAGARGRGRYVHDAPLVGTFDSAAARLPACQPARAAPPRPPPPTAPPHTPDVGAAEQRRHRRLLVRPQLLPLGQAAPALGEPFLLCCCLGGIGCCRRRRGRLLPRARAGACRTGTHQRTGCSTPKQTTCKRQAAAAADPCLPARPAAEPSAPPRTPGVRARQAQQLLVHAVHQKLQKVVRVLLLPPRLQGRTRQDGGAGTNGVVKPPASAGAGAAPRAAARQVPQMQRAAGSCSLQQPRPRLTARPPLPLALAPGPSTVWAAGAGEPLPWGRNEFTTSHSMWG